MKRLRVFKAVSVLTALLLAVTVLAGCGASDSRSGSDSAASSAAAGSTEHRSSAAQKKLDQDIDDGYLILVNKEKDNHLSADCKPADLEQVKYVAQDRSPAGWYMRKTAAEQFNKLSEDAKAAGIDIVVTTAYRSYDFQSTLFNNYVARDGEKAANKYSARPGESEHQTGLAADLSTDEINYVNGSEFGNTKAGKWVAENCYKYGFIIRFPDGKEDITGYTYEPWHIRYVGKTAAKEIHDEDITLEQYIKENKLGNSIPSSARTSSEA